MEPAGDRFTPPWRARWRFPVPISGTPVVKTKFPRPRIIRPVENRPTAHAPRAGLDSIAGTAQYGLKSDSRRYPTSFVMNRETVTIRFVHTRRGETEFSLWNSARSGARCSSNSSGTPWPLHLWKQGNRRCWNCRVTTRIQWSFVKAASIAMCAASLATQFLTLISSDNSVYAPSCVAERGDIRTDGTMPSRGTGRGLAQ